MKEIEFCDHGYAPDTRVFCAPCSYEKGGADKEQEILSDPYVKAMRRGIELASYEKGFIDCRGMAAKVVKDRTLEAMSQLERAEIWLSNQVLALRPPARGEGEKA